MVARLAGVAALFVALIGCDPGFVYSLAGTQPVMDDGARYAVNAGDDVVARFYGSVFTVNGRVEVQVMNRGDTPLSYVPTPTVIADADGTVVPSDRCHFSRTSAAATTDAQKAESLGPGDVGVIACRFNVELTRGLFHRYARRFDRLSFTQPGFSRSGRPIDIHATMVGQ